MTRKPTLIPAESWNEVEAHIAKKRQIKEATTQLHNDEIKARREQKLEEDRALKLATDEQKRMIKERKKAKGIKPPAPPEAMELEIQGRKDRAANNVALNDLLISMGLAGAISNGDDNKRKLQAQAREYSRKHGV